MTSGEWPVCAVCGKTVVQSSIFSGWHHYYTEDFEGPCYWGKPDKPWQLNRSGDESWYRLQDMAEDLADNIGSNDPEAANVAYWIAGRMKTRAAGEKRCGDAWHSGKGFPYQCPSCGYWVGEGIVKE